MFVASILEGASGKTCTHPSSASPRAQHIYQGVKQLAPLHSVLLSPQLHTCAKLCIHICTSSCIGAVRYNNSEEVWEQHTFIGAFFHTCVIS